MSKTKKKKTRTTQSYYSEVVLLAPESPSNAYGPVTVSCPQLDCVYLEIGSKRVYIDASCEDVYVSVEGTIGEAFIGSDSASGADK